MDVERIPAFAKEHINVIVETPRGSKIKYAYDPQLKIVKVEKELPEGFCFPFDFGFIPNTLGEDGDPLDVIIMMNTQSISGVLVECRVVGAILAEQDGGGKKFRNDRILAVPADIPAYKHIRGMKDLGEFYIRQVENFFVSYNAAVKKTFTPGKKIDKPATVRLIKKSLSK